jgi:hypothetical protein
MSPSRPDIRNHEKGADQGDDAYRHVEIEDPAPVPVGDDQAAEGRPRHRGDADHRAGHAERRTAPLGWKDGHQDGDRLWRDQRAPDPLDDARGDQLVGVLRESAEGRGAGEDDQAEREQLAWTKQVTQPPSRD